MTSSNLKKKIFCSIILILLTTCTLPTITLHTQPPKTITVEIADEQAEQAKGLMYRKYLPEDHGMLFVFNETKPLTFWMKNTLIPLDLIFIANDTVVSIKRNFQPCKQELCENYISVPADKVLEANAGFAEKNKIIIGTKISF